MMSSKRAGKDIWVILAYVCLS